MGNPLSTNQQLLSQLLELLPFANHV